MFENTECGLTAVGDQAPEAIIIPVIINGNPSAASSGVASGSKRGSRRDRAEAIKVRVRRSSVEGESGAAGAWEEKWSAGAGSAGRVSTGGAEEEETGAGGPALATAAGDARDEELGEGA